MGLLKSDSLTAAGRRLVEDGLIRRQDAVVRDVLRAAYRELPALKALLEGHWGLEIDRGQAEDALRYGYAPARGWTAGDFTRLFEDLNYAGLLAFNRRRPAVRVLTGGPAVGLSDEGGLITPTTRYRNKRMAVDLVRSATDSLLWFDAHLDREGLAFVMESANFTTLKSVRLLSVGRSELSAPTLDDYRRARADLKARGIELEWRTILRPEDANMHDRWMLADKKLWNLPPLNQILRAGKFGSIVRDNNNVPLEDWWRAGTDLLEVGRTDGCSRRPARNRGRLHRTSTWTPSRLHRRRRDSGLSAVSQEMPEVPAGPIVVGRPVR